MHEKKMGNEIPSKSDGGFFADFDVAAREALYAPQVDGGFFADPALLLAVRMRAWAMSTLIVFRNEAHLLAPIKVLLLPRRSLKSDV